MSEKDKQQMNEIREYLVTQYQGASDAVKLRINILLRNIVTEYHQCTECGKTFDTNDEDFSKSSIIMYPSVYPTNIVSCCPNCKSEVYYDIGNGMKQCFKCTTTY